MTGPMGGPGQGLQLPQNLYPSALSPYDFPTNELTLAAGDALVIPRGDWIVETGSYTFLQWLDPVTGVWTAGKGAALSPTPTVISSDGNSVRLANLTGCPVGRGIVNAYGSAYVQASTTVSVTGGGGSTWQPIVGGQLTTVAATIVTASAGAGYGVAPLVFIPAPPPAQTNPNGVGGIQASAFVGISSGTVSGFTFTNPGAGYPSAPTAVILPSPYDPNLATGITAATVALTVTGSGSITGVLNTNSGAPLSTPNNITLTVSGAGTNATVSAVMLQTITTASIIGGSTISGSSVTSMLTTAGGEPKSAGPATPVYGTITNNPIYTLSDARPRQAAVTASLTSAVLAAGTITNGIAGATGVMYDSGLFYSPPTPVLIPFGANVLAGTTVTGSSTITYTMGSRPDTSRLIPLRV